MSANPKPTTFETCAWCRSTNAENRRLRRELSALQLSMASAPPVIALVSAPKPAPIKKRTKKSKLWEMCAHYDSGEAFRRFRTVYDMLAFMNRHGYTLSGGSMSSDTWRRS
jgi:hypothetical protein